jgi:hypothetical protein
VKEIVVLHDPEAERSLVVLFFENEDDYRKGDECSTRCPQATRRGDGGQ